MSTTTAKKAKKNLLVSSELKSRGLIRVEDIADFLIGRRVITKNNYNSGHSYGTGVELTLDNMAQFNVTGVSNIGNPMNGFGGGMIYYTEMELLSNDKASLKRDVTGYEKRIEALMLKKQETEERIKFLDETEATEVDESQYRKWVIKKVFSSELSEDEKINKLEELLIS